MRDVSEHYHKLQVFARLLFASTCTGLRSTSCCPTRTSQVARRVLIQSCCSTTRLLHGFLNITLLDKLRGYETQKFIPTGVKPHQQRGVSVQLPNRRIAVSIIQIPLISAYSITDNKSQGLTGPINSKPSTRSRLQHVAHYVATLEDYYLDQFWSRSDLGQRSSHGSDLGLNVVGQI